MRRESAEILRQPQGVLRRPAGPGLPPSGAPAAPRLWGDRSKRPDQAGPEVETRRPVGRGGGGGAGDAAGVYPGRRPHLPGRRPGRPVPHPAGSSGNGRHRGGGGGQHGRAGGRRLAGDAARDGVHRRHPQPLGGSLPGQRAVPRPVGHDRVPGGGRHSRQSPGGGAVHPAGGKRLPPAGRATGGRPRHGHGDPGVRALLHLAGGAPHPRAGVRLPAHPALGAPRPPDGAGGGGG